MSPHRGPRHSFLHRAWVCLAGFSLGVAFAVHFCPSQPLRVVHFPRGRADKPRRAKTDIFGQTNAKEHRTSLKSFDAFCSHSWGEDGKDHQRVCQVAKDLQEIFQISTFMDEEQVRGGENLKHQLTRAIRNSIVFICFVTASYCEKMKNADSCCYRELNHAKWWRKRIIPVLMEENVTHWPGPLQDLEGVVHRGDSGGELRDTFTLVDVALDVAAYLGRFGEVQERARGYLEKSLQEEEERKEKLQGKILTQTESSSKAKGGLQNAREALDMLPGVLIGQSKALTSPFLVKQPGMWRVVKRRQLRLEKQQQGKEMLSSVIEPLNQLDGLLSSAKDQFTSRAFTCPANKSCKDDGNTLEQLKQILQKLEEKSRQIESITLDQLSENDFSILDDLKALLSGMPTSKLQEELQEEVSLQEHDVKRSEKAFNALTHEMSQCTENCEALKCKIHRVLHRKCDTSFLAFFHRSPFSFWWTKSGVFESLQ
ncbi:unnamed protein product [Durusdinium trenchii]|uniref:TIR domain-containing protein n=1 Tax=Durusdinium trenchii TaxID=1381693 RepID=A0ABP0RQ28_9DINO